MFWICEVCGAQNHESDGECQYCECEGPNCQRNNCSDPCHFMTEEEYQDFLERGYNSFNLGF